MSDARLFLIFIYLNNIQNLQIRIFNTWIFNLNCVKVQFTVDSTRF